MNPIFIKYYRIHGKNKLGKLRIFDAIQPNPEDLDVILKPAPWTWWHLANGHHHELL